MVTDCGAKNVKVTETSGACATEDDNITEEPDITVAKMAG
jgi:hypothetical protein